MPCDTTRLPGGGYAIICGRRSKPKACVCCGRPSSKLCDFPLTGAKEGSTCDRALCANCAVHRAPDTDYCPTHGRMIDSSAASKPEVR